MNHWNLESEAKEIFQDICNKAEDEQEAALVSRCEGRPDVCARIRELIDASKRWQEMVNAEPGSGPLEQLLDRKVIGGYRLIRRIGTGGMSHVYLGEKDGATGLWAVKVLEYSVSDERGKGWFRREVEALTRLNHPNLIQFEEGVVGELGEAFIVTRYFDGQPLDRYCESRQLELQDKLALFEQICRGVSYANRREVIHRDLKPSNILVNEEGVPKVLDFGVAKLLDDRFPSQTTQEGLGRMTMRYSAPEQLLHQPVSASSDVYALGVILFEVLLRRSPYQNSDQKPLDLAREVTESEPIHPRKIDSSIAKDLEAIMLKALRKEPEKRFLSAEDLADDIHRFREGFPVLAHSGKSWYWIGKIYRRHRAMFLAGGVAVLGLAFMQVWIVREKQRSERRFEAMKVIATDVLGNTYGKLFGAWGVTGAQAYLCQKRVEYLDFAIAEKPAAPDLTRELIRALFHYGTVLGLPQNDNLGKTETALQVFLRAEALASALFRGDRGRADNIQNLAHAKHYVGRMLLEAGRVAEADAAFHQSADLAQRLSIKQDGPETRVLALALAAHSSALLGERGESLKCQLEATRLAESILRQPGDTYAIPRRTRRKSMVLLRISAAAYELGDPVQAGKYAEEGIALERQNLKSALEVNYVDHWYLALHLANAAQAALERGGVKEAAGASREAVSIYEMLVARNSTSASVGRDRLRALFLLARSLRANGKGKEAQQILEANLEAVTAVSQNDGGSRTAQDELKGWLAAMN